MAEQLKQPETLIRSLIAGSDVIFDYVCQPCSVDDKTLEAVGFCVDCSEFLCDDCFKYHKKPTMTRHHKLVNIKTRDYGCQPCSGNDETLDAVGFCVDCSEFLCDDCFKYHKKPTISRHHKLVDIETAKNDTSLTGCFDICTEYCSQHRGKIIEYFCKDHDCLGCGVCITMDHRNCKGVQYIPKIAKDTTKGEELSSLTRKLDMMLLQTKVLADTFQGNKIKSQDTFDKALEQVKQVRKNVNDVLKRLENEIKEEAEKIKTKDMQKMDKKLESCSELEKKTQKLSLDMQSMLKKEQYCNLFVAMKTNTTEMRSIMKSLEDISSDTSVSDYQFQPDEQLANFLKHVGSFGTLCKTDDGIKTEATKVGEINVGMWSDSICNITGFAMITSARLVAVDWTNKKVKLIDVNQVKDLSEIQLPWSPYDITINEETREIAVTQKEKCEIVLLRIRDDRLYDEKTIKTTSPCLGIACIKDRFVVSLTGPQRLEIIDKQGNVLQTIVKDENGEELFIDVQSVTVCQDTGTIFVPDYRKNTVTKLSLCGSIHGVYRDMDLRGPSRVAVDKGGAVYVFGRVSSSIHQITRDCKKIRVLLTNRYGFDMHGSMCYDVNTDRLYVGEVNNTKILIYQLS